MSEVDLSSLNGAELRRLLESTRARGQESQSEQILQELAERRARAGRSEAPAPPAGQDLAEAAESQEPPLTLEGRAPRPTRRPEPADGSLLARPRRRLPILSFSLGVALGLTVGVGVAREAMFRSEAPAATPYPAAPMLPPDRLSPPPSPAAVPAALPTAQAAPSPAPPAEAVAEPTAPGAVTAPPQATVAPMSEAPVPTATASAEDRAGIAAAQPTPAPPEDACAAEATPADRTICADPALQRLQRELRQSYAQALQAHADRALLRRHQLAWREARNSVTDPARLAQLYEARIRKLHAAAAAAQHAR